MLSRDFLSSSALSPAGVAPIRVKANGHDRLAEGGALDFVLPAHLAKQVTQFADAIRVAAPSEKLSAFTLCARQVFGSGFQTSSPWPKEPTDFKQWPRRMVSWRSMATMSCSGSWRMLAPSRSSSMNLRHASAALSNNRQGTLALPRSVTCHSSFGGRRKLKHSRSSGYGRTGLRSGNKRLLPAILALVSRNSPLILRRWSQRVVSGHAGKAVRREVAQLFLCRR